MSVGDALFCNRLLNYIIPVRNVEVTDKEIFELSSIHIFELAFRLCMIPVQGNFAKWGTGADFTEQCGHRPVRTRLSGRKDWKPDTLRSAFPEGISLAAFSEQSDYERVRNESWESVNIGTLHAHRRF